MTLLELPTRITHRIAEGPGGCWEWTGGLDRKGYGRVWFDDHKHGVHRLMYRCYIGEIPDELVLDHLCRNPICCNPAHLEPVTPGENLRRSPLMGMNNGNHLKTHCPLGHPYDEANTRHYRGRRHCRRCGVLAHGRWLAKRQINSNRSVEGRNET